MNWFSENIELFSHSCNCDTCMLSNVTSSRLPCWSAALLPPQVLPKLSVSVIAEVDSILRNKPSSKKQMWWSTQPPHPSFKLLWATGRISRRPYGAHTPTHSPQSGDCMQHLQRISITDHRWWVWRDDSFVFGYVEMNINTVFLHFSVILWIKKMFMSLSVSFL